MSQTGVYEVCSRQQAARKGCFVFVMDVDGRENSKKL
jgi:hypothetical protein